jgi:hypothetical protein
MMKRALFVLLAGIGLSTQPFDPKTAFNGVMADASRRSAPRPERFCSAPGPEVGGPP